MSRPPVATNGHHPDRAIAFDNLGAIPAGATRAYRAGYAVGVGWQHARPLLCWLVALAVWPLTLYLLPALLAYHRGHPHWPGIHLWTLLLGWTGTGWLAALGYTVWTWEARMSTEGRRRVALLAGSCE